MVRLVSNLWCSNVQLGCSSELMTQQPMVRRWLRRSFPEGCMGLGEISSVSIPVFPEFCHSEFTFLIERRLRWWQQPQYTSHRWDSLFHIQGGISDERESTETLSDYLLLFIPIFLRQLQHPVSTYAETRGDGRLPYLCPSDCTVIILCCKGGVSWAFFLSSTCYWLVCMHLAD